MHGDPNHSKDYISEVSPTALTSWTSHLPLWLNGVFSPPVLPLPFDLWLPLLRTVWTPASCNHTSSWRQCLRRIYPEVKTLLEMRTVWDQPSLLLRFVPIQWFPYLSPLSDCSTAHFQQSLSSAQGRLTCGAHSASNSRLHFTPTFRTSQHDRKLWRGYAHQPPPFWGIINTSLSNHSKTAWPMEAEHIFIITKLH